MGASQGRRTPTCACASCTSALSTGFMQPVPEASLAAVVSFLAYRIKVRCISPRHSLGSFQDRLGFRGAPPQALGSSSSHPCAISRQTPAAGRRYIAFQCNALLAPQPQLLSPSLLKLTCARTLLLLHLALPSTNPVVHRFPRGARLLLPDIGTNLPTPEAAFRKQLAECT